MDTAALKRHRQQQDKVKRVKELMEALIDETNTMASEKEVIEGMYQAMTSSHRFLQNEFMRALLKMLEQYAKSGADPRNAWAVKFAEEVAKLDVTVGKDEQYRYPQTP